MSLTPSTPSVPNPAKRPERTESIDPEDIAIGGDDDNDSSKRGRRALRRPSGNVPGSDSGVGTGLSA